MAKFHNKLVLNKYMLSLFGIEAIGKEITDRKGSTIFKELKLSTNEGYSEEGNTKFLKTLINHLYLTEHLTKDMLQGYDDNIVRFTHEISSKREETITWKYFQYLSLLFTEIYLDKYFQNKYQFLAELNDFTKKFNVEYCEQFPTERPTFQVNPFRLEDLNKLAFWNATGSGKTLIMHINIKQYLFYANKYQHAHNNKVILITPNEGLSKQHLNEFYSSNIPATIFNKDGSGMFSGQEVEVLEITKLAEDSGDKTVAVDSFETDNLVLIDEGHGGMAGDSWKRFRDQLSQTGFAFEYSATFGQAINAASGAKKKDFTQEYAKSILFDYSYKYFYQDGYGKDYRIINLNEDNGLYQRRYLTANLLSYYQQLLLFQDKPQLVKMFNLHKPLWLFVGGKVNAVRKEGGKDTSDVLEIIYFLTDFLKDSSTALDDIDAVLHNRAGLNDRNGNSIFANSFTYLQELKFSAQQIYRGINELVFNNKVIGANLYLDNLKGADGELGLRVGESNYFGVVNVGDEKKLHELAMSNNVLGIEKEFSNSLFRTINEPTSLINLLIGSKKFSEGWSSWRVSSMGLMNIGKSEGSQIIQLFGRGVRLKGIEFSLKRSTGLDNYIKPRDYKDFRKYLLPLETLQVFGVKADYMEQFKKFLEEEGLPPNDIDWVTVKVPSIKKNVFESKQLKLIQVNEDTNFKAHYKFDLILESKILNKKLIEIDWYPKIDVLENTKSRNDVSKDVNVLHSKHLALVDWNKIYLQILNYKAEKRYFNLNVSFDAVKSIAQNNTWYQILMPKDWLKFDSFTKVNLWQDLVLTLLKKYIDKYYLFYKNKFSSDNVEVKYLKSSDDNFVSEYDIRLNSNYNISHYKENLTTLLEDYKNEDFSQIAIGSDCIAFDNILHLYKPLVYLGKSLKEVIQISPVALDESEKQFLDDFIKEVSLRNDYIDGIEFHILRNQSRKGLGFFAEGNNFFPDFIIWMLKDDKQYINFVDPKGIRELSTLNDPKIQFHKVIKERIQPQVIHQGIILNSFIVSNSRFETIQWKERLTIDDFHRENVYFQTEDATSYIRKMIEKSFDFKSIFVS